VKLDFLIAHASWDDRRKASLDRLTKLLPSKPLVLGSVQREHANVWAARLWDAVACRLAFVDAVVLLNDDVIPHPQLREHVEALCALLPGEVISLHGNFPGFRHAANAGHKLARCYWPSGPAYVLQRGHAAELLNFVDRLPAHWFDGPVNEDGVIAAWLWSRQTPAYVSIPALVRHDTSVPSTLAGYDDHPNRTSPVDWADFEPGWTENDVVTAPYVPVPWMTDNQMRELGDALRGVVPLCGFCYGAPSTLVNGARGTGVCFGCANIIQARTKLPPFAGRIG
jgi:hypothetical protein